MTDNLKPKTNIESNGNANGLQIPRDLKAKARLKDWESRDDDPVARAEEALRQMSCEFEVWMTEEVDRIMQAHREIEAEGMSVERAERLYVAAHDLKGQAQTLGHPLIGEYCALLCKLFDAVDDKTLVPQHAIRSHIEAVQAAMRNDIRDREDAAAIAVLTKLGEVVTEFCQKHESGQPVPLTAD